MTESELDAVSERTDPFMTPLLSIADAMFSIVDDVLNTKKWFREPKAWAERPVF
jgi:hypothetical protein